MPTPQKAAVIDELAEQLSRANLAILTDYRGLKVSDIQGLRAQLRPQNAEFHIAKNTFTRIAAERVGIDGLQPVLDGPLALVFAYHGLGGKGADMRSYLDMEKLAGGKTLFVYPDGPLPTRIQCGSLTFQVPAGPGAPAGR